MSFSPGAVYSLMPNAALGNRSDILAADIPAGGKTSAGAIARMYAAMLDEVDGVRLMPPARLREATGLSTSGMDEVLAGHTRWALGYAIGSLGSGSGDRATVFGVGGVGGSFAYGDTATGISFAVTKNRLTMDFNAATRLGEMVTNALR